MATTFLRGFGRRKSETNGHPGLSPDDEAAVYAKFQNVQQDTWREWIAAPLSWLRPVGIVCAISLIANVWQYRDYQQLAVRATTLAPYVVVVDPTKTKVLQTVNLDPAQFSVDQEAEKKMVRDFITAAFSITSDPRRARQQKQQARGLMVDQSTGLLKMDGWWAQPGNDPIIAGANGTVDVTNLDVTPLLGDHHWSVQWTLQPYDLQGHLMPATSMKGELSLQVIMPRTEDEAKQWYPYTFVRDFSFGRV